MTAWKFVTAAVVADVIPALNCRSRSKSRSIGRISINPSERIVGKLLI